MPDRSASVAPATDVNDRQHDATAAPASRVPVLLPLPLDGAYDYAVPADMHLAPGDLVVAPLGGREVNGVVWDRPASDETDSIADARLRPVIARHDVPAMPEVQRRFIDWVAGYTLAPPGAVLRMALSAPRAFEPPKPITAYRLAMDVGSCNESVPPDLDALPLPPTLRLTPARRRVIALLADGPPRPASELAREAGVGTSVVKGLLEAGVLERVELAQQVRVAQPDPDFEGPALTSGQRAVADQLRARVDEAQGEGGFSVTLLDGVTGSGKTVVYFEAVAAALAQGRQVLVLLPEIALTAQWLQRFRDRFGAPPAEWHSELSGRQRRATWRAVAEGEARIVVGARSALFLPYPDLGLIVVDEEHESAFKQEDGVTYHARDMAVVRARLGERPIVLVSATPSLETVMNVKSERYGLQHLPDRHGSAGLPDIELIDLRGGKPPRVEGLGQSWLSPRLRTVLQETLDAGEQAMLFLNRRGYAPLTLCRTCGHRLECPNCTAWLVEHRLTGRLQCHHCGYASGLDRPCPDCGDDGSLAACGPGVERLAEEVVALFPEASTRMVSSDTITGPQAAAEFVHEMQAGAIDLLIGTQVIAKGHHFPRLTCVGVVDADLGLTGGDLRAAERTYQLLGQVAGRAGRAERPGRVLLQTYEPEHPVMQALVSGDRDRFLAAEAETREQAGMPPFARLAALIVSGPDPRQLDDLCRVLARKAPRGPGIEVLGPAPAPLAILRRRHRRRFLMRTRKDIAPQKLIRGWLQGLKLPSALRLQIDIDPYSFM